MNVDEFRELAPAFADVDRYPDAQVEMFIDLGVSFMDTRRWPRVWRKPALVAFVSHHLVMLGGNRAAAAGRVGPQQSKTVSDVSVSYDTTVATDPKSGHFNLTAYGLQWRRFVRMVGAGPRHLPGALGPPRLTWHGA